MWCDNCGQDVPGVAVPDDPECVCCARCRRSMTASREKTDPFSPDFPSFPETPQGLVDGWRRLSREIDGRLDDALLVDLRWFEASPRKVPGSRATPRDPTASGVTAGETGFLKRDDPATVSPRRGWLRAFAEILSWVAMTLGAILLAFGAVLLGWALVSMRGELWGIGLPAVVAGQSLLLIGLFVQFDELYRGQRRQYDLLCRLDHELRRLRQSPAASRRSVTRSEVDRIRRKDRDVIDVGL